MSMMAFSHGLASARHIAVLGSSGILVDEVLSGLAGREAVVAEGEEA